MDTSISGATGPGDAGRQHVVDSADQQQVELRQPGIVQQVFQAGNRAESDGAQETSSRGKMKITIAFILLDSFFVTLYAFDVPEHTIGTKAVIAVSMIVRYFFMSSKNYCSGFKGP